MLIPVNCILFHFRSKRLCRCGAGQEATAGKGDTPGFQVTDNPEIRCDHRKAQRLYMDRNHGRINQTATDVLQSWRANCDVQILIYDSHPDRPNIAEISKVTDYVVAYSCKGNQTLREEKQHTKQLIMASQSTSGDQDDLTRICRQVMNKAASHRLIPKQEACVLVADLPLVSCSEQIENVSITNTKKLKTVPGNVNTPVKLMDQYKNRDLVTHGHMSLHDFFFYMREKTKKTDSIPHYVGVNGYPCYPVSRSYARHVLIVYKPWTEYPKHDVDHRPEFEDFINSRYCPESARMLYDRVLQRFLDKTTYVEPTNKTVDHSGNPMSAEDEELIRLIGLGHVERMDYDTEILKSLKRGLDHQWDKLPKVGGVCI